MTNHSTMLRSYGLRAPRAPRTPPDPRQVAARAALNGPLVHFIGPSQRHVLIDNLKCEEKEWFIAKVLELNQLIATMPHEYQQEGMGDQAMVYLHYFAGGQANAWIRERDSSPEQLQAFGYAEMFPGGGELGYISIAEWISCNGELDLHFTPCTYGELRTKKNL